MTSLLKFIFKRKKKSKKKKVRKSTEYNADTGLWLKQVARVLKPVQLLDFKGNVDGSLRRAAVMGGCI